MTWDRRATARAYAVGASDYAVRFGDDLATDAVASAVLEASIGSLAAGSRVLDGGCGPSQLSSLASDLGHIVIGADVTFEMLDVSRRALATPRLTCADLLSLPFAPAVFDAAMCWFSLHNLPRHLLPTGLAEIARVLRIGAPLVLATHAGEGEETFDADDGTVVVTYYEPSELAEVVAGAGFENVTTTTRPPRSHEHQVTKVFASARRR